MARRKVIISQAAAKTRARPSAKRRYTTSELETELGRLTGENAASRDANTALHEKLKDATDNVLKLQAEVERLTDELKGTEENVTFWRSRFDDMSKRSFANYGRAQGYEKERDNLRVALEAEQTETSKVERQLNAARVYAEQMRRQAYPQGPRFPWEPRS